MAHPSAQIKVDLRLAKGRLSYGTAFMKVEKPRHGSQMTLRATKCVCIEPDCLKRRKYSSILCFE